MVLMAGSVRATSPDRDADEGEERWRDLDSFHDLLLRLLDEGHLRQGEFDVLLVAYTGTATDAIVKHLGSPSDLVDELLISVHRKLRNALAESPDQSLALTSTDIEDTAARMAALVPRSTTWDDAAGPFYDGTGVATFLGVTRQALAGRRARRTILALRTSDDHLLYPVWQFGDDGTVMSGLREVLQEVPEGVVSDWTLASWLKQSRHAELVDLSVAEHLAKGGEVEPAVLVTRRSVARWSA